MVSQSQNSSLPHIQVEYSTGADMSIVKTYTQAILKDTFSLEDTPSIEYKENASLVSGLRVFVDDDMVDATFQHFSQAIKEI